MSEKIIFIFDAKEGDQLSEDVNTPDGKILVKKDTILDYDVIANISNHHILEVRIYDNDELEDNQSRIDSDRNTENEKYFDTIRKSRQFKGYELT